MLLLRLVEHASYGYHAGPFLDGVTRSSPVRRVVVMSLAGSLAGVGWLLLRRAPGGAPGTPEIVRDASGRTRLLPSLPSAVLQIVTVGMGLSLGREGAPKEFAAAIGGKLAELSGLSASERRALAAMGAGAGLAAVYNVPLGGAVFALEVLLGTVRPRLVVASLTTAAIATLVSWIWLPNRPTYDLPHYGFAPAQIVWSLAFGVAAGVACTFYVRAVGWAKQGRARGLPGVLSTIAVFAAIGALATTYPQILGNGKDVAQLAFVERIGAGTASVLFLLRAAALTGALRAGVKAGLFTPTLTLGALVGGITGVAWSHLWPGGSVGSYAVIGAAAVLSAAMKGPVSAVVLMLELVGGGEALVAPMLLAVTSATLISRLLDARSIYSIGG